MCNFIYPPSNYEEINPDPYIRDIESMDEKKYNIVRELYISKRIEGKTICQSFHDTKIFYDNQVQGGGKKSKKKSKKNKKSRRK